MQAEGLEQSVGVEVTGLDSHVGFIDFLHEVRAAPAWETYEDGQIP